jgi:hypothetical protein
MINTSTVKYGESSKVTIPSKSQQVKKEITLIGDGVVDQEIVDNIQLGSLEKEDLILSAQDPKLRKMTNTENILLCDQMIKNKGNQPVCEVIDGRIWEVSLSNTKENLSKAERLIINVSCSLLSPLAAIQRHVLGDDTMLNTFNFALKDGDRTVQTIKVFRLPLDSENDVSITTHLDRNTSHEISNIRCNENGKPLMDYTSKITESIIQKGS